VPVAAPVAVLTNLATTSRLCLTFDTAGEVDERLFIGPPKPLSGSGQGESRPGKAPQNVRQVQ